MRSPIIVVVQYGVAETYKHAFFVCVRLARLEVELQCLLATVVATISTTILLASLFKG